MEIQNLLDKKCIYICKEVPHVVNPLTVAYNYSGKPRMVLDCRTINPGLYKENFAWKINC